MDPEELKAALIERDNAIGGRLEAVNGSLETLTDRIEAIEAKGSFPRGGSRRPNHLDPNTFEGQHFGRFLKWIRNPKNPQSMNDLDEIERRGVNECKDVTIGSGSAGGFAVPEEIGRMVEKLELSFSPVRRMVKVVKTNTSDYKELVSLRGGDVGWVGETSTRTVTDTPTLREVVPTHGELYAYPQASEWSLDDAFFDVPSWLAMEIADGFAVTEGLAVIDGDGTNKPTGLLDTTPVLTDDFASPLRAAAAFQYIACDTDIGQSPTDQAVGITSDCLIDTVYKLKSQYRANAVWVMNSNTAGAVRKLKTADGVYHWQSSLILGQPPMLLGYPVETWEQMPDIADDAFPIGFGDFRRGYLLADRVGLRITVDQVTRPGYTRFYVRRRVGGIPLNNDSIKFIRTLE
jgi:HK97 family phage major capsid protein